MDHTLFETVEIDEDTLNECEQFAARSTNNYRDRGQGNKIAIKEDILFGKIGEWIADDRLRKFFIGLTYPDMNIYEKGSKSWKSDATAGDLEFAVKTCDYKSKQRNSLSWIFQKMDAKGRGQDTEIYGTGRKDKLCVFIELGFGSRTGRIRSIAPLSQLHDKKLFWAPRVEALSAYKDAVYYDALNYNGFGSGKIHATVEDLIHAMQS